jgi:glycosyltransferase involved in cell wall biosynthesis
MNITAPKISVIIPVWNGESFLKDTIDSVLLQSFVDFELLAMDDGSDDTSPEIIRSYNDRRVKYFRCGHDFIRTVNRGISLAAGKYIAFIDHDDIMTLTRLQTQYEYMEANVSIAACGGYMQAFGKYCGLMSAPAEYHDIVIHFIRRTSFYNSTGFMRNEFVRKHKLQFKTGYSFAADLKFWSDTIKVGKVVPVVLNLYRTYNAQTSLSTLPESRKGAYLVFMDLVEFLLSRVKGRDEFVQNMNGHLLPTLKTMTDLAVISPEIEFAFLSDVLLGLHRAGLLELGGSLC